MTRRSGYPSVQKVFWRDKTADIPQTGPIFANAITRNKTKKQHRDLFLFVTHNPGPNLFRGPPRHPSEDLSSCPTSASKEAVNHPIAGPHLYEARCTYISSATRGS